MRPHKLVMQAFGPFVKRTTVDFDAMGNSIYLICGDTGSGKTFILDGITYALYGTASGGARSGLPTESFHSDFSKSGNHRDEMRVEFTFSNAGKTYVVCRSINWGKNGVAQKPVKESVLSEDGNVIVHSKGREDRDDVTAKIGEILGLDADQFRRIIVLAQGEFQKFLTENSSARGQILGKLYDNRRHQDFQLRLKAASALLNRQDRALVEEGKAQLGLLYVPDGADEDTKAAIDLDHPQMLAAVQSFIDLATDQLSAVRADIAAKEQAGKELQVQKAKGEAVNRQLDTLEKYREELAGLEAKKPAAELKEAAIARAEAAGRVIPSQAARLRAEADLEGVCRKIESLSAERDELAKQAQVLKEAAETTEKTNSAASESYGRQLSELQGILHFYDDLAASTEVLEEKTQALNAAKGGSEAARKSSEELKARRAALEQAYEKLSNAGDPAVNEASRKLQDLNARMEAIEDIESSGKELSELKKKGAFCLREAADAQQAELAAEEKHLKLNSAFVYGQAGILADEMRAKLKTEPFAVCPVCGTKHGPEDEAHFAKPREDAPTKAAVDEAFKAWGEARKAAEQAQKEHASVESDIKHRTEVLLGKSETVLGITDLEALLNTEALADARAEGEMQLSAAKEAYTRAVSERDERLRLEKEKEEAEKEAAEAAKALEEAEKLLVQASNEATAARTSVDNWKRQLQGRPESKAAALAEAERISLDIQALSRQTEEAKARHAKCLSDQAENSGNLAGALSEKEAREKEKAQREAEFALQLEKNGFAKEEELRAAMSPEGSELGAEELASWAAQNRQALEKIRSDLKSAAAVISQLEEATRGCERTDLAAISEKMEAADAELEKLRARESVLAAGADTDSRIRQRLGEILAKRAKYAKVYSKLEPMSGAANGNYAFSRYVLSGFFRSIVDRANVHLDILTSGEYRLVPKDNTDGRKLVGLDLGILNTITTYERENATLSGGQLFEASMALALGLSDVAQMQSTSRIQIDSMFIDEGFGTLDGKKLDNALKLLQGLSAGSRQIGIISHVDRLDETLPNKIHVIAGKEGSTIRIETDA